MELNNDAIATANNHAKEAQLVRTDSNPTSPLYAFAAHIYDLDGVINTIKSNPQALVYVLGLGSDVDDEELRVIVTDVVCCMIP